MNIFFLANNPAQTFEPGASFQSRLGAVGFNTGNQLFTQAVLRQLKFDRSDFGFYFDPAYVQKNFDAVVVPAANWMNSTEDFGPQADRLERLNLPIYVFGLGSQSKDFSTFPVLMPGTLRLLKLFAERCPVIGVRGEYTRRVLEHYGVTNVQVTGCPSTYWHCKPGIDFTKRIPTPQAPLKVAFNGTRYHLNPQSLFEDTPIKRAEWKLTQSAFQRNDSFIYQSEKEEIELLLGRPPESFTESEQATLQKLYGAGSWEALHTYIKARGHVYFYPDEWLAAMPAYDFAIGTRLHGCMTALISGRPACLITHDARTVEIARFSGIPNISVEQFLAAPSIEALYEQTDMGGFQAEQAIHYWNYVGFLEKNGLPHTLATRSPGSFSQSLEPSLDRIQGNLSLSRRRREQALDALDDIQSRCLAANHRLMEIRQSLGTSANESSRAPAHSSS